MITDGLMAFFKMAAMSSLATWPPTARQSDRRRSGLCRPKGVAGTEQPRHVGQLAGVASSRPGSQRLMFLGPELVRVFPRRRHLALDARWHGRLTCRNLARHRR